MSTRGHSVLPRGTYGFAPRRFGDSYAPEYVPRRIYDSSHEEYALDSAVTNATSFSDASLYDSYDTVNRSRGRDASLLSQATAAIPPSSQMATSSRTASSLPGRRFLSNPPRPYIPEFDESLLDTPKTSGTSLPTAHLSASAPPRPNLSSSAYKYSKTPSIGKTASKISSLKTTYDDGLSSVLPARSSRLLGGYVPKSLFTPGSPYGSGTSSPVVRSTYSSAYSPYHKTSYHNDTSSPSYQQSTSLLGGYIPPKRAYRPTFSPLNSGTHSPIGRCVRSTLTGSSLKGGYLPSRLVSAYSPSLSPYASGSLTPTSYAAGAPNTDTYIINDPVYPETSYVSRSRPRVLGTKRRVGNYVDRLRRKRAGKQGSSKYWPYIDVEDINSEAGDVISDTESLPDYYDSGVTHWDDEGAVGGYVDTYRDTYDDYDDYGDSFNDKYMQEPDEYVPFKPRRRLESPGVLDLSPYESTPVEPDLPLTTRLPYVPSVSSSLSGSSKANDLYFNSLVSSSASRARTAFKNNGLHGYENASLVLSVEGDVVSPSTGGRYGFKYYHPPVPLVGSGIGDSLLSLPSPSTSVDSFFGNYMDRLRDLRAGVRSSLESKALTTPLRSPYKEIGTYTPSKPSDSFLPYTSYRKRLLGGTTQRVDVIELPVSERVLPTDSLSLTFPDTTSEHDRKRDTPYKLTVLDKIKIKVSSEPHTVSARAAAASRRVARKQPAPQRPLVYRKEVVRPLSTEAPIYSYYPSRPRSVIVVGAKSPWQGVYVVPIGRQVRAPSYFEERARAPSYYEERARAMSYFEERARAPSYFEERARAPSHFEERARRSQSVPLEAERYVYRGRPFIYPANYYTRPYRAQAPPRYFRLRYPQSGYVTYRKPRRAKAAIVASKVEIEPRRKRPRSKFAADKLRATRVPGEESIGPDAYTSTLHASRPPLPLPSERRAIRDVDGFTKPRNLLSWQYRMEARMDPTDIIYKPGSFTRMRAQVRDAHDKLDRHRQLLDRYLTDGSPAYDVHGSVQRKMEDMERRDASPVSTPREHAVVKRFPPCVATRKKKY